MRIKDGFVMRKVAGKYVVVATGEASRSFHGMIKLNETGRCTWQGISEGKNQSEITEELALLNGAKTDEDRKVISDDVQSMIDEMAEAGFLISES
ncbi:MAG: PqqD family protein [Oscillospiraceae bacterium]|nr:PqqD family protein [Oscillospiraceae bacterium]